MEYELNAVRVFATDRDRAIHPDRSVITLLGAAS